MGVCIDHDNVASSWNCRALEKTKVEVRWFNKNDNLQCQVFPLKKLHGA